MGKASREQTRERTLQIRRLLLARNSPTAICGELKISLRTFERYIRVIRQQDQKWLDKILTEEQASAFRLTINSLEEQIRQIMTIRKDSKDPKVKLECTMAIRQLELDIIDLLEEGPVLLALRKAREKGLAIQSSEIKA